MQIRELELQNVRGVVAGGYRLGGPVTLISGGTASGRSALLRAVVHAKELVGPCGVGPDPSRLLEHGASAGSIVARWAFSDEERAFLTTHPDPVAAAKRQRDAVKARFAGHATPAPFAPEAEATITCEIRTDGYRVTPPRAFRSLFARRGSLALFPADRALEGDGAPERDLEPALSRQPGFVRRQLGRLHARQAETLVPLLEQRRVITQADVTDVLAPIKGALAPLVPHLGLSRTEIGPGGVPNVWLVRRDGQEIELGDLSSSERQGVLFAATFVLEGLARSVVLIEQPERDVPRAQQAAFFRALCELAAEGQIIAATDSPEILATPGAHVVRVTS